MTDSPVFFVPEATPEKQESVYAELANWCQRSVPKLKDRIYSITYIHDNGEWTAIVGEPLRGIKRKLSRSKGKKVERTIHLKDPAIVLAIFPGYPFMVVTNGNRGSAWVNPFTAGQPKSITYFA